MERELKRDTLLLLIAFASVSALVFGELLEQIVFVPNWLIGNVDQNMEHFRQFKHTTDPGMFYFPLTIVAIASHLKLLGKGSLLSDDQKKSVRLSLILFSIVFAVTIYVIVFINIPVIDNGTLSGEAQKSKIQLWAILNMFRIILPAFGLYELGRLFVLKKS
ncbi:hypothetical protein [Aureibacter tunicatorum]|uniref:DUF4149 domain-containing protein n=1 Tax=Aureibacter tunicatorum TaxID=866807 RepID=A0AAE3XSI4_9BACT|nr:hypothetical protein [Aureibacter tunicatorum]MDR6241807.1 hypothetical protein [Aureibacter tunicatorum]BDD07054.1 hypothetical protein AUTU_45370 [Aureibacter tunicatorum]